MVCYKLTDVDGYTRRGQSGETHWEVGATVTPTGAYTGAPCGPGCLHLYGSAEEAVLYDPVHGVYGAGARCFRVEATDAETDGLKWWTPQPVQVVEEVLLPLISLTERAAWAICLAPHPSTREWAVRWLDGADRSEAAARAAARAAEAAVWAAEAARAAAEAARAAVWAAARAVRAVAGAHRDFPARSLAALACARAILAGTIPAQSFDGL